MSWPSSAVRIRSLSACATSKMLAPAPAALEAAAARAGWRSWEKRDGIGHGIGFARYKNFGAYCAVVAEVETTAEIECGAWWLRSTLARRSTPTALPTKSKAGRSRPPAGPCLRRCGSIAPQSPATVGRVTRSCGSRRCPWSRSRILARPQEKPLGAGEAAHSPTAAAIGNAVFDALGVRVRVLPLTRERVLAAMG